MSVTPANQLPIPLQLMAKLVAENPTCIRPLGNYLIVELFKPDEKSLGGIHLPNQTQERSNRVLARVVKVGPGHRSITTGAFMEPDPKPGDLVIITRHAAQMVTLEGVSCHVVAEGDVIGIVDEMMLAPQIAEAKAKIEAEAVEQTKQGEVIDEVTDGENSVKEVQLPSGLVMVTSSGGN